MSRKSLPPRTLRELEQARSGKRARYLNRVIDAARCDSAPTTRSSRMPDSQQGTTPDRTLDKLGTEQPKPPTPTGNKSKDGETLDSLLSHNPGRSREF
jgi:hypothetical protein